MKRGCLRRQAAVASTLAAANASVNGQAFHVPSHGDKPVCMAIVLTISHTASTICKVTD